jgi:hypothetical protein
MPTLILCPMAIGFYSNIQHFLSFRSDSGEISHYVFYRIGKLRQGFLRFAPE